MLHIHTGRAQGPPGRNELLGAKASDQAELIFTWIFTFELCMKAAALARPCYSMLLVLTTTTYSTEAVGFSARTTSLLYPTTTYYSTLLLYLTTTYYSTLLLYLTTLPRFSAPLLQVVAMGFSGHKYAYMSSGWNVLDFTVVVASWLPLLFKS